MKAGTIFKIYAIAAIIGLVSGCAAPSQSNAPSVQPSNYAQPTPHKSAAQQAASMISPVTH